MIIRLRSRDGLERIEVDEHSTVAGLKLAISQQLKIPMDDMQLSLDVKLLTPAAASSVAQLANPQQKLKAAGVGHGTMVYLKYSVERAVSPVYKPGEFDKRQFGAHITVEDVIAKQTRIERQDKALVASVSFDTEAANQFQQYVQGYLTFNIKRGGILYGTVDEEKNVKVDLIYEPPQQGSADSLSLERGSDEEAQVEVLAGLLGFQKVGWIFSQSIKEREFIISSSEVVQMAQMQAEIGDHCVTCLVSLIEEDGGRNVHVEAFQCSEQAVKLVGEGWILPEAGEPSGVSHMKNPKEPDLAEPVIVAGKDVSEVDNDWFLCPMGILQHSGRLHSGFPIENRLIPQTKSDLKAALQRAASLPYQRRIADFHLLLWLAKQPNLDAHDLSLLAQAIREDSMLLEGYQVIIDSIAGL